MSDEIQKKQIIDYTSTTTLANGDKLLLQKADGTTMNVDYTELARNIITQYNAQTLAGSAQSIQSAFAALNSNLGHINARGNIIPTDTTIEDYADTLNVGFYVVSANSSSTAVSQGFPIATPFTIYISVYSKQEHIQIIAEPFNPTANGGDTLYIKHKYGATWREWIKLPSRSEFTSLNNRLTYQTFGPFACTTTTSYASTGQSFTMTKAGIVRIDMPYGSGRPTAIGIKMSESASSSSVLLNTIDPDKISDTSGISVSGIVAAGTYYIWARTATNGSSNIQVAYYALSA